MTKPELLVHLRNDHRSYARVRDSVAKLEKLHGLVHDPAWTGATRTKFVRKQEGWVSFGPPNHTHPGSGQQSAGRRCPDCSRDAAPPGRQWMRC